jgi:hypothetical protein
VAEFVVKNLRLLVNYNSDDANFFAAEFVNGKSLASFDGLTGERLSFIMVRLRFAFNML